MDRAAACRCGLSVLLAGLGDRLASTSTAAGVVTLVTAGHHDLAADPRLVRERSPGALGDPPARRRAGRPCPSSRRPRTGRRQLAAVPEPERRRTAAAGRRTVRKRFSVAEMADALAREYGEVCLRPL